MCTSAYLGIVAPLYHTLADSRQTALPRTLSSRGRILPEGSAFVFLPSPGNSGALIPHARRLPLTHNRRAPDAEGGCRAKDPGATFKPAAAPCARHPGQPRPDVVITRPNFGRGICFCFFLAGGNCAAVISHRRSLMLSSRGRILAEGSAFGRRCSSPPTSLRRECPDADDIVAVPPSPFLCKCVF